MSKILLDIVTPERKVYSEKVEMVITRAADGDIGILPQHAPLVSPLTITVVRAIQEDREERITISGGFLEVRPDKVTILAETAELSGDIDIVRAKSALKRAEERINDGEGDLARAELALKRAENRLEVTK